MKKIVKLLPVTLALLLAAPAFAAGTMQTIADTQSTELNITLPAYFDIQVTPTKEETSATFQNDYSQITLDEPLGTTFKVITNDASAKVALTAKAGNINETEAKGLYGEGNALKIVFANTVEGNGSVAATAADVIKITDGSDPSTSANAFALALATATCVGSEAANAMTEVTPALADGQAVYTLQNGKFDFTYLTGDTAVDNSFNTYDTYGTYKATLTLSKYTN